MKGATKTGGPVGRPRCNTKLSYPAPQADSFRRSGLISKRFSRPSTTSSVMTYLPRLLVGQLVHQVEHDLFAHGAQGAGAGVALQGALGDQLQGAGGEFQLAAFHAEELLVLLHQRVLRLGEDVDQRLDVQRLERRARPAVGRRTRGSCRTRPGLPAEPAPASSARSRAVSPAAFSALKPICRLPRRLRMMSSRPTNVPPQMNRICARVHLDVLLLGMLAAALRGDVGDGAFEHLQQGLLHAFAGDVAGDADVVAASCRSCRSRRCR